MTTLKNLSNFTRLLIFICIFCCPLLALAWIDFTPEELNMTPPDWCPDADVMVLNKFSDYKLTLDYNGTHLKSNNSLRMKIFTTAGKNYGDMTLYYGEGEKITKINARTITPKGKEIKLKSKQIFKSKVFAGEENEKVYHVYKLVFPQAEAGSILEIEYDAIKENFLSMEPFYFDYDLLPTLNSKVSFTIDNGFSYNFCHFNTKNYNFSTKKEDVFTDAGMKLKFTAEASRIKVSSDEVFSPPIVYLRPVIYFAFTKYEGAYIIYNYATSWRDIVKNLFSFYDAFGKEKKTLDKLFSSLSDKKENKEQLARSLFRWVADSIEFVDTRDFDKISNLDEVVLYRKGTGADKTLLLKALYDRADIKSRLLLTTPRTISPIITNFPSFGQFQDVLLELKIDTVKYYVDPTYPKEPFNRLRWYYQDVKALPIDEEVFDFIRLPLDDTGNYLRFDVQAEIDDAGNLSASGCAKLTGEYCFRYRDTFKQIDSVKFKELLIDNFFTQFKAEEILSPSIDTSVCNDTCIGINFNLKKAQYAEKIEDELIFPAYFVDPIKRDLFPEDTSRSNSIQFSFPYTSISSVQLQLPPDYIYDANPLKLDYNRLGESLRYLMNISSSEEQDIIFIIRNLRRKIVVASKEDYPAIRDFYQKSALNDNYKIVIHK